MKLEEYPHARNLKRKSAWGFVVTWALVVIVTSVPASLAFCDSLSAYESSSATIRNLALVVSVAIALPLAIWRSMVAGRQAETAYRGLLNERYQKGSEMLGSRVLSVRLGGIYALRRLSEEHPEEYHLQIMRLFCAYVRDSMGTESLQSKPIPQQDHLDDGAPLAFPLDCHEIMDAVLGRDENRIRIERKGKFRIDLRGADLHKLRWSDFAKVKLCGADLSYSNLSNADFAEYSFIHDVDIDFSRVSLLHTDLSGTNLCLTKGLTQSELSFALADPESPPNLKDLLCARTGKPLVWRD
ncbi:MAG: pentapeptide repeat-containing protein [Candidatus Tectomicrobia bacterium]|nr:pentapeptide repeat-containing protein [Candidatus Tectomicrobia bacterium]